MILSLLLLLLRGFGGMVSVLLVACCLVLGCVGSGQTGREENGRDRSKLNDIPVYR